jgi:hypothetical protein
MSYDALPHSTFYLFGERLELNIAPVNALCVPLDERRGAGQHRPKYRRCEYQRRGNGTSFVPLAPLIPVTEEKQSKIDMKARRSSYPRRK